MTDREQCRDLAEWQTIGTVTTSNGMLTIVPPYYARSLGEWWDGYLAGLEQDRSNGQRRPLLEFEEIKLEQITYSVTNPDGYRDGETALAFATGNGGWDVEARFCHRFGEGPELCELRIRLHHFDDEPDEEPNLTPLASRFGWLLGMALKEWCDLGRFKGRRLDDLLFNEWDPARDGDFSGWVLMSEYADYQPGAPLDGEPCPPHRNIQWPLLVIQTATQTRDPDLVAAILKAEVEYELGQIAENDWVDQDGNPAPLPPEEIEEDQRAVMAWPAEWRRVFSQSEEATP